MIHGVVIMRYQNYLSFFCHLLIHSQHTASLDVQQLLLTLKVPSKICSRRHVKILFYFSEKTSVDISCELSAKQTVHMKCQDLFSLKNNNNKKK